MVSVDEIFARHPSRTGRLCAASGTANDRRSKLIFPALGELYWRMLFGVSKILSSSCGMLNNE
jgi:hypothetical protein